MIPVLAPDDSLEGVYRDFLTALAADFEGDICADLATRVVTATDNSVYQVQPQAVVYPKHEADIVRLMRLGQDAAFRSVTFTARGGGTGTNGQSLADGIIVDVSRHMNQVLDTNLDAGTVRVQPGVVLDQLNRVLAPHGVFFAPNLSPSSRATIGGMMATDACGKGSRVYGRTSEHVVSTRAVTIDGDILVAEPLSDARLSEARALPGRLGAVHRVVDEVITENAALIDDGLLKLRRFMTGYNLGRIRDGNAPGFDLSALICGSEGTLVTVTEATLRLTPIPTENRLVVLKYRTFTDALGSAELVAASEPSAIETIDQTVMNLARDNVIWHEVGPLLDPETAPGAPKLELAAINLVEYAGTDATALDAKVSALIASVEAAVATGDTTDKPFGYHLAASPAEAKALWSLRKQGVGLLGSRPGARKPVAFVEDTVVPPENLRDYVRDFRALLDSHGLFYGMFGHIDVGCLHVRPALDMSRPDDERLLKVISDGVVALVQKYGGQIWGEHGKGMRSEYNPVFFGPELYALMRTIKTAFDPDGRLNPGKLAIPDGSSLALATVDGPTRGAIDRTIPLESRAHFQLAMNCNGNGACHDVDPDAVMCPSSKVTRDRRHSPKGRAGLLREWLRRMGQAGYDPTAALVNPPSPWFGEGRSGADFSHEVYDAMDGCLACKACATRCPIKVDVPSFRTDFLALYHTRYRRPLRDHLVAALERLAGLMAWAPRISNLLSQNPLARWVLGRFGLVDTPSLSVPGARPRLARRGVRFDEAVGEAELVFVTDIFTTHYEAEVLDAAVAVAQKLGMSVGALPCRPSGKGHHIKGFTSAFKTIADERSAELRRAATSGAQLVGVDPAVTLIYRDEVPHAVGRDAVPPVLLLQEWLDRAPVTPELLGSDTSGDYWLMGHCTERTAAPDASAAWRRIFQRAGLTLHLVEVGCCGMCGVFGHEAHHQEESRGVYAMSWERALANLPNERVLATGFSCRHQVKRFGGFRPRHPIEVLAAG